MIGMTQQAPSCQPPYPRSNSPISLHRLQHSPYPNTCQYRHHDNRRKVERCDLKGNRVQKNRVEKIKATTSTKNTLHRFKLNSASPTPQKSRPPQTDYNNPQRLLRSIPYSRHVRLNTYQPDEPLPSHGSRTDLQVSGSPQCIAAPAHVRIGKYR